MLSLGKFKNLILNAGNDAVNDAVNDVVDDIKKEPIKESKVDYDFGDIKKQIERFCSHYKTKNYVIAWKFPNIYRVCRGKKGVRLADFKPFYVRYLSADLKHDINSFFKNTKFLGYFNGNVKLKEIE